MRTSIALHGTLTALLLTAAGLAPAAAQEARLGWSPWIGCWQAEDAPAEDAAALCVRLADDEDQAVEILRVEESTILDREVVWADGARHETVREECTGWEEGTFSRDGRRVLLNSSHTCEDGVVQEAGGIMALSSPDEWLDVRYMKVADEPTAWVQRYRPADLAVWEAVGMSDLAPERVSRIRGARMAAAQAPDVEDVIEASNHLPAAAVEAWVAEKGDAFDLDPDKLVAMADAGVADRVIDVVVAVSNPDVFALSADGAPERATRDRAYRGDRYRGRAGVGFYDPFFYNRFRYRAAYGYGYSPFGFGYGGYGYSGYGYRPTVIVVDRKNPSDRRSRVIAGKGYRGPSSSSGGGSVRPSRNSGGSSAAPSSGSSTRRPSSTGRKAKPKKPGGGSGGGGGIF